jgi:pSer/pThr/pTyr-binding forkhead associated (FHA) protein
MPYLTQKTAGGALVKQWTLDDKPFSAGRGENATARFEDDQMSRLHFTISSKADGFVLEDCKSRNGTFVNDKRTEGEVVLRPGDRIRAGQTFFVFETGVTTMIGKMEKEGTGYGAFVRELSQQKKDS